MALGVNPRRANATVVVQGMNRYLFDLDEEKMRRARRMAIDTGANVAPFASRTASVSRILARAALHGEDRNALDLIDLSVMEEAA